MDPILCIFGSTIVSVGIIKCFTDVAPSKGGITSNIVQCLCLV